MTFYRDPLAGLRSQIATKRGLLESRERSLPALLRAMLPAPIQTAIRDLRERALAEPESLEGLTSTDGVLDEILRAHDEAQELLPKLRECPDEVPDPPKPQLSPPWIFEESSQLRFRAAFTKRLEEISPEAYVIRRDDTTYMSRLTVAGAPIIVTARINAMGQAIPSFHSAVRTSVPGETPELEIRCERLFDGIGRVVGLVHDAHVGDEAFDKAFVVNGEEGAALLTSDVRGALLAMEALGPKLHVKLGVAEIEWTKTNENRPNEIISEEAIAVILGVRAAIERA